MTTNMVMLVKDRLTLTRQALDSLVATTADFTLTIIDDESLPGASDYLRTWAENMRRKVSLLRTTNSTGITGLVRNLGVYYSEKCFGRGDFLYLSDNDVCFTPQWLTRLTRALEIGEELGYRLLGGSTHPFHGLNSSHGIELSPGDSLVIRSHDAVSGYSQLMRWETWDKYGPLDAHAPGIGQSEDWKFCQQIVKDGGLVGSVWPEMVYGCGLTTTWGKPAIGSDSMRRYKGVIQQ